MTAPHLAMTVPAHDRLGEHRRDGDWLDARWAEASSQVLVVSGTRVRAVDDRLEWLPSVEAPEGTRVLLGERDGVTSWAVVTDADRSRREEGWSALRGLLPVLLGDESGQAPLVFHALGIAEWLWVTRFCPRCGEPLAPRAAGHELACVNGHTQFPRTDAAVIMVVTTGEPGSDDEACLLGRSPQWPPGRFSTLAGFYEPGETLEDTVRREVLEETGVAVGDVEYFGNQPWPLPASLMLGFVARATSTEIQVDEREIEDARWFTRQEMRSQAEAGTLVLPGGVSISRSLVEHWFGGALPGHW